tara:strand:+ start:16908 stop:17774 length:867 start_codon:yes stop_codon:yes gene_type:complete
MANKKLNNLFSLLLLSLTFVMSTGCSDNSTDDLVKRPLKTDSCPGNTENTATGNNDVLVWADEFNENGIPCTNNWTYDIGNSGWGNNEIQYYKKDDSDNVIIADGVLKITAVKELYKGSNYTSTRMKTQGLFSFTYGKVEVRAKLPDGGGTWPAIWMLGDNFPSAGWPACGEIDIMEHVGNRPGWPSSAIHNPAGYAATYFGEEQYIANVTSEFHVYGVIWSQEKIEFTVDGVEHFTYNPAVKNTNNWPFSANQFIILNVAMGGNLGGNIPSNFTKSTMEIDYVRVYQ